VKRLALVTWRDWSYGGCNAVHHLGMEVIGYDPYISVDSAWGLS